ncbi:hypothetical protein AAFC00_005298 [Neodothiora populina]|uniref:Autophagy-related protein 9 n=1 Tax=Neodothiora populina TaxID=2781224 RepID=A0ABR3PKF6_9PEZI
MMASRILSRFLPNTESGVLFDHRIPEIEAGDDHDQRTSSDHELDALLAEAAAEEHATPPSSSTRPSKDDVPHSLLVEGAALRQQFSKQPRRDHASTLRAEEQWRTVQDRQPLHNDSDNPARTQVRGVSTQHAIDAREQALWLWTNVQNLDAFLLELYEYYAEHGIWSMLLSRAINMATTAFLFSLYMFMSSCIDYSKIPASKSTSEVLIPKCMQNTSFAKNVLLWCFTFWWCWMLFKHLMDVRRLWSLHEFYHHLLNIPDIDLQTVSWERVVEGLMKLRNSNARTADDLPRYLKDVTKHQAKQRMDAHDIANRLMRRDNYFVALFNKEIFDLSLPVPFLGTRQFYSKSLEFCIQFCFQDFIFDHQGQVKPSCLKRQDRNHLIQTLRRRLRFTAIMSIILAPVNIGAHCIYYFSRYYAEFRNSPSKLSARAFTPLAEWKFREFNELQHDFRQRMRMSYPFADDYLNQFPRDKTHQLLQFVSLVSGTLAGLLGLATLLDPELFLGFEITPGRTAFFYISILMAIFAGARGGVPDESEVHDPVLHLMNVIHMTHYQPSRGRHQLHSNDVRVEFSSLYQMKILIFLEEIMSLIIAPFVLWKNSGKRSETIVDFFRNSTVQVDGLGYLCAFSVFDFRKSKNVEDEAMQDTDGLREEYFGTKDDKMAKSQFYFMQRVSGYDQKHGPGRHHRPHFGLHLPPSFPPMSPLRQTANKRSEGKTNLAAKGRSASPQRSILLDLPHQQRHGNKGTSDPRNKRSGLSSHAAAARRGNLTGAGYISPDELEEDPARLARLDAMTTSRLIEEDNSLGDSWKVSASSPSRKHGGAQGGTGGVGAGVVSSSHASEGPGGNNDKRTSGGVLGLLVEYSKAHAGGKGPKIG